MINDIRAHELKLWEIAVLLLVCILLQTNQPTILARRACEVAVGARSRRKPYVHSSYCSDCDQEVHRYCCEDEQVQEVQIYIFLNWKRQKFLCRFYEKFISRRLEASPELILTQYPFKSQSKKSNKRPAGGTTGSEIQYHYCPSFRRKIIFTLNP